MCWISAGVSSFIAGYLERDTIDEFMYVDVSNAHPDSMRFIKDCEKMLGKEIRILESPFRSVENVIRQYRFINSPYGAKCTSVLKKDVRKRYEAENREYHLTYVWGYDVEEANRAEQIKVECDYADHQFPLMERFLTKQDAHAICDRLGIERPVMYDLGYPNNNCIGCVKGGMGYWNKIRVDFPEVFDRMAKLEREIGHSCINGVFLDELEPGRGSMKDEISQDCGILCLMNY